MDLGPVIALLTTVVGVAGGMVYYLLGQLSTARQVIEAKSETIATLQRQIDRLEVTALLSDKLLRSLPPGPQSAKEGT